MLNLIFKTINYKIGWTEPVKTARSGEIRLRLFDEDGFAALKKAQRNNEDLSKVKELRTVSVYHAVRNLIYFNL